MKKCKHCGHVMEDYKVICDNCNWGTPTKKQKRKSYDDDYDNEITLNIPEVKQCKYCRSTINKKAKVCPVCKRTLNFSIGRVLLVVVIVIGILILLSQCSIRVVPTYTH